MLAEKYKWKRESRKTENMIDNQVCPNDRYTKWNMKQKYIDMQTNPHSGV